MTHKKLSQESKNDILTVYAELYAQPTTITPQGVEIAEHLTNYLDEGNEEE
jgi:hypothetical protein|tara:strand:- start:454 stop:606 length:153 start_codon:yes stop_codon:yes gene_type:complete